MGVKVRIEHLSDGYKQVLTSDELKRELERRTKAIADAAGDGFEASVFEGKFGGGRWVGMVEAKTSKARRAEAEDKALSKAIGAGK